MTPGIRLKELLASKGITPYKLAHETGISQATLSRVLKNDTVTPNRSTIHSIATYLKVNTDWILTGEGDKYAYESSINTVNESDSNYLNDNNVSDYLIENTDQLLKNKKFATWYENVRLKAQQEILREITKK